MLPLPRKTGERRRYVYGKSEPICQEKYRAALGIGPVRVRPGSISEFVVLQYVPWLEGRVQAETLTPDSLSRYDHAWQSIVAPALGHLLFSELTLQSIQTTFARPEFGGSTKTLAKTVLSQIVRLGIALGKCDANVLVFLQLVSVPSSGTKHREDMSDKAEAMLAAAEKLGHWTEGFIYAGMWLGCRKGEICGIKRTDIDEVNATITIRRQRNHTEGERDHLKARRKGQNRVVGLPPEILARFLSYFRDDAIYLVTYPDGSPPPTNHFDRYLKPVEEAAGVVMTPHDFRSAAICRLIDAGVDDHVIMDLVGHGCQAMIRRYRDSRSSRTRDALSRIASSDNQ